MESIPTVGDPPERGRTGTASVGPDAAEARLVAALRAGSEPAFEALVRRYEAPMLRLARVYVSNQASAEDVVQETWLAVMRGVDGFGGRSSLKSWLYRILVNRAKTAGQRESRCVPDSAFTEREIDGCGRAVPGDRFLDAAHAPWPQHWKRPPMPWERVLEDGVVTSESLDVVIQSINQLPDLQRLVVTLRDMECWAPDEVCVLLDLSASNQRVLLHRARSALRQRLATYERAAESA